MQVWHGRRVQIALETLLQPNRCYGDVTARSWCGKEHSAAACIAGSWMQIQRLPLLVAMSRNAPPCRALRFVTPRRAFSKHCTTLVFLSGIGNGSTSGSSGVRADVWLTCWLLDGISGVDRQGDAGDVAARAAAEIHHRVADVAYLDKRDGHEICQCRFVSGVIRH